MKNFLWPFKGRSRELLGFEDWPLVLIGVPVVAFITPIMFFGVNFEATQEFALIWLRGLAFSGGFWLVNRQIVLWFHYKLPLSSQNKKRILLQYLTIIVATLIVGQIMHLIFLNRMDDPEPQVRGSGLFITLFISSIYELIYLSSRWKRLQAETEQLKKEQLQSQLNLLKSQVNPHFLFNSLNTLTSLIPDEPSRAIDFVQKLSTVYRQILEVKEKELIPLAEELTCLNAYIFLIQTRYGENITFDISISAEQEALFVVPFSLQILIENSIKHNIISKSKPLTISISASNDFVIVSNNLQRKDALQNSTKTGLHNINNRCLLICDRAIEIVENGKEFKVQVPLMNVKHYASINH